MNNNQSIVDESELKNYFKVDGQPGAISSVSINDDDNKLDIQFNKNISGTPDIIYTPISESPLRDDQGNNVKFFRRKIE